MGLMTHVIPHAHVVASVGMAPGYAREVGPNKSIKKVKAFYIDDWDILSFFQDLTPLVAPSAIGERVPMDGPYNVSFGVLELVFPWTVLFEVPGLGLSHLRPAYLYGLLSETNTESGDDIFGHELP